MVATAVAFKRASKDAWILSVVLEISSQYSWNFQKEVLEREQLHRVASAKLLRPKSGFRKSIFSFFSETIA